MTVEKSLSGSVLKRDDGVASPAASRTVGGAFDAVYARVSGFVLSQIEALLDRRAEARAVRPRPPVAVSNLSRGRSRVERLMSRRRRFTQG